MDETKSAVSVDIFDTIAQQAIPDLAPNDMTKERFSHKYDIDIRAAERLLSQAIVEGKITRSKRRWNGTVVSIYVPKE